MGAPYSHKKRQLVPQAMRAVRLANGRKWCRMGDLCASIGWNKGNLVSTLEEKRTRRAGEWFQRRLKLQKKFKLKLTKTRRSKNLEMNYQNWDTKQRQI